MCLFNALNSAMWDVWEPEPHEMRAESDDEAMKTAGLPTTRKNRLRQKSARAPIGRYA